VLSLLKSVGKHFAIYGLGNVANYLVGFFLLPLYTHYLTPSDYGTLELIELTVYIAGMFMGAGIVNAVLRFYFDTSDARQRNTFVSTAILSALMAALALGALLIAATPRLADLIFGNREFVFLLRLAISSLALSVVSEVPLVVMRARQQSVLYVTYSLVQLLVNVAFNIWFITHLHWGVRGIVCGGLLTRALGVTFLLAYTLPQTGIRLSWNAAKVMFAYGAPLVLGGLNLFVLNFSDRFFLKRLRSLAEVGLYALGYKFGMLIGPMVTDPFMSIWKPKMFEIADQPDARSLYARMLTYFLFLEFFVVTLISVMIKDVIVIMTDPSYHDAYKIVPVILLAYVFWGACSHVQVGILLAKRTKYIAYLTTAAALSNVIGNLVLVRSLGMWGAALTTVGSYALLLMLTVYYSRHFLTIPYEYMRIAKLALAALLLWGASLWVDTLGAPLVTIPVKLLLALTFPLVLWPLRFYQAAELAKIKEFCGTAKHWLSTQWSHR
jgi:O-antigen/teichoic acid export membrane protein